MPEARSLDQATVQSEMALTEDLLRRKDLSLNAEEARKIQEKFSNRSPTEIEIQTIAQTWSEHCFHKVFKSKIRFGGEEIDGLFRSFIKKATMDLAVPWIVSAFEDNAGIIEFDGSNWIAAKVETHNHPSAVDPFGGAATGVGGVIRDILGVWAEPIANTDVLCFSDPASKTRLPSGAKSAGYLLKGVVGGIGTYGNNMGIPTVNGAVCFDDSFAGYTLVFCGCVGLLRAKDYAVRARAGDILVLAGSRTGREGIHGVNFASSVLDSNASEMRSAVQIPNPIEEEKLKRAVLQIASKHLAAAITDLGGGGLSSAVCEIANRYKCGAVVDLASVPTSSPDVEPWEAWISETQERMLFVAPPETLSKVLSICEHEELQAVAVGRLTEEREIVLQNREEKLGALPLDFLFEPPLPELGATKLAPKRKDDALISKKMRRAKDFDRDVLRLLSTSNICSKEKIIRTYDHEVRGETVVRPLQYPGSGPNDGAVIRPIYASRRGLTLSCGINPSFGSLDPYWMTASVIDEAIRNGVAMGGRRFALLDNFAWGSPDDENQLASLVGSARACYDFATAFGAPFISGKDSLYNQTALGPVAPTLLITALGIVPDIANCVSCGFKEDGSSVYLIGKTGPDMGGSEYFRISGLHGFGNVPGVDASLAKSIYGAMNEAMDQHHILSCHDISNGGLAVALSEMCFTKNLGVRAVLPELSGYPIQLENYEFLFSESNSRFIAEVKAGQEEKFENLLAGNPLTKMGKVGGSKIKLERQSASLINVPVSEARLAWTSNTLV